MVIFAFLAYWIICGFAAWQLGPYKDALAFGVCMVLGGFLIPARAVAKLLS